MLTRTFDTMGTTVSLRLVEGARVDVDSAVAAARAEFDALDQRFSLYREDSEISRIARGELILAEASDEMRDAYGAALEWRDTTGGAFTPHRPDGVLDLSGTIKAVGIQRAADALSAAGLTDFAVNCGGDILFVGKPDDADAWTVGIVDPTDRTRSVTSIRMTAERPACATSSNAERGEHIWRRPDTDVSFTQVTVVAADILTADVCATAIIAGGAETMDALTHGLDIAVFVALSNGEFLGNQKFSALLNK